MKHLASIILLLSMAVASLAASTFEVNGITYEILSTSELTCLVSKISTDVTGDLVIPATVNYKGKTLSVIAIGDPDESHTYGEFTCGYDLPISSVTIPNTVRSIGPKCFRDCPNLKSVSIGNSVEWIGWCAFSGCAQLTKVSIPANVLRIKQGAFSSVKEVIFEDGDDYLDLNQYLFSSITKAYVGRKLSGGGLTKRSTLLEVEFGNALTHASSLSKCTALEKVTFGRNIETIGGGMFAGCSSLKEVQFPDKIKNIESTTFNSCSSLTNITFGKSVERIGMPYNFSTCSSLVKITCLNPTPPKFYNENSFVFTDEADFTISHYTDVIVEVPSGSVSLYQTASVWKNFWDIRAIETDGIESVETISENKPTVIYDLQGHKLGEPQRGINIINGKKLLVK